MLLQQIINGIIIGSSYALIALGLNLIWSITDIADFAQGGIYVLAAYVAYYIVTAAKLPFILAWIGAMVIGGGLAYLIERFLYRRWTGKSRIQLLCAIALFFLMANLAILWFTPKAKIFPSYISGALVISGFTVSYQRIAILLVSAALFVVVFLFIMKTKIGKAIRAASQDRLVAEVVGININTVNSTVFIIGGMLSATAAVLISPLYAVFPSMGDLPLLKSLVVVILGGFGSVAGVLVGGLSLGLAESLGSVYISSAYQHGFAFFVLILVLMFFPKGLFGRT
ncbi:MAG: branched-chain amino acid ABC transporter permease [Spirochaetales bacterium]|nr:branched-chain amino acid ABC transporter permease [Spirochaetales bacterium]